MLHLPAPLLVPKVTIMNRFLACFLVLASVALVGAHAQRVGPNEYQFTTKVFIGLNDLDFFWSVERGEMKGALVTRDDGWFALGFSETGVGMAGLDVIFCDGENRVCTVLSRRNRLRCALTPHCCRFELRLHSTHALRTSFHVARLQSAFPRPSAVSRPTALTHLPQSPTATPATTASRKLMHRRT